MTELFDTRSVRDDSAHWDMVAASIAEHVALEWRASAIDWLARSRGAWAAALLLLTAGLIFSAIPAGPRSATTIGSEWERAIGPTDTLGRAVALRDAPPAVGELLLPRPDRRER